MLLLAILYIQVYLCLVTKLILLKNIPSNAVRLLVLIYIICANERVELYD